VQAASGRVCTHEGRAAAEQRVALPAVTWQHVGNSRGALLLKIGRHQAGCAGMAGGAPYAC
jgi:hypothetical protein